MKRANGLYSFLAIMLLLTLAGPAHPSGNQVNRFTRDGLSFTYPSEWVLEDRSDAQMQTLSLDRGPNEAKIVIAAFREPLTEEQTLKAQSVMTQAIADRLALAIQQAGGEVQRSSVSALIGGAQGGGVRLRSVLGGEAGNAEVYWVVLGGRLIHLVYVGTDRERARADFAWNTICSTLRVGEGTGGR